MKKLLVLGLGLIVLSGCSTHMTKLEYEGGGVGLNEAHPVVNEVVVSDERGTDSDWLGAIRGGYGNRLKTLRTEKPTDQVVDDIYTNALIKSGLYLESEDAPYSLNVRIDKFDCSYYFNREAHAHVNVSLVDNESSAVRFSKSYKTDEVEGGIGAGIFGNVDTLRNLAETAMNKTVDKTLNDPEFARALLPPTESSTEKRLNKLNELLDEGYISEEEYQQKRAEVLSEI